MFGKDLTRDAVDASLQILNAAHSGSRALYQLMDLDTELCDPAVPLSVEWHGDPPLPSGVHAAHGGAPKGACTGM